MALANAVSFIAQSSGAGAFVFATARPSFLTPAQAVALGELVDGQSYSYLAQDSLINPVQREWGTATFTSATSTFARNGTLGGVDGGVSSGPGVQVNFSVPPVVSLTLLSQDVTFALAADTNLYVSATGSDSNDGRTSGTAWLTLQHAINTIAAKYNFAGFKLTLNVGAGSFAGFGVRSMTGGGVLLIKGAGYLTTTITAGVNDGLYCFGDAVTFNQVTDTVICVDQLGLAPGATGNYLNFNAGGSIFCFGDWLVFAGTSVNFGACATVGINLNGASNIFFAPGNVYHAAAVQQTFLTCEYGGNVSIQSDIYWNATCTWSVAAFLVGDGGRLFNFSPDFHNADHNSGTQIQIFFGGFVLFGTDLNLFPGTPNTYVIESGGIAISGFTPAHNTPPAVSNQAITSFDFLGMTPMTYSLIFPAGNTGNTYETPREGWMAYISDAVTAQIGAVVNVGGGTNKILARFNGTDWVVFASNALQRQILPSLYVTNPGITFYVATTGNDTTGNGTVANPWATPQKAWNYISTSVDLAGNNAVIQMADGDYPGVALNFCGCTGGYITFQGNASDRTKVTFDQGNQSGFGFANLSDVEPMIQLSDITIYNQIDVVGRIHIRFVNNIKLMGVGGDVCIRLNSNGGLGAILEDYSNDAIADFSATPNVRGFLDIDGAAKCYLGNFNTIVTGTGVTQSQFIKCNSKSLVQWNIGTPTITGTGLTGQKFLIDSDSEIIVYGTGLNCIPGSTPGQINCGTYSDQDPKIYSGMSVGWMFPIPFAQLPPSPSPGMFARVGDGLAANCSDGSCTTFGTVVTGGGGTLNLLVWYNGTNWTLMGGGATGGGDPGPINIATIVPLVGDGLTDNTTSLRTFVGQGWNSGDEFGGGGYCKTAGGQSFPTVVTLTLGSPGVVNWSGHGLRVNETVVFATTGALPSGLVAGTPYYVMFANLTANSFQVSTANAVVAQAGDGPAVNFTGSQSGTQYARTRATEWQQLLLPPGAYNSAGGQAVSIGGGQRKLSLTAYGSASNSIFAGGILNIAQGLGGYVFRDNLVGSAPVYLSVGNASIPANQTTITCSRISDAANFWVGGWICIGALDIQNQFGFAASFPPNNHYNEFALVSAINLVTGQLTLTNPLRNGYCGSFPTFYSGAYGGYLPANSAGNVSGGGQPTIWPMSPEWDTEQTFYGLHDTAPAQFGSTARRIKFVDCRWDGQGPVPSMNQSFVCENCDLTSNTAIVEIDKLIEYVRFTNCNFGAFGFSVQSSSVDRIAVEGCLIETVRGTGRLTHIKDSWIGMLLVGVIGIGAAESLVIENSRVTTFGSATTFDFANVPTNMLGALLNNWTFTNGTLSQPMLTTTANRWAVPGRRCFINDFFNSFDSMGACFTVLDVYQGAANNNTVTISVGSPAVVSWTGHPFSAGDVVSFTTTGMLPGGLQTWFPYYVIAAGLGANSFEISTSLGGPAVNTTGSQSGVHTAYRNPTFNIDTTLSSLPFGSSTTSTVTIDIANPAVIHWALHGLVAGTLVIFQTTGALPTGLSIATPYYVLAAGLGANQFEVSTSVGGTPVITSGTQSGTQTAISNPLKFNVIPCPRVTVRNCTGCPQIADMSNGPENVPLWSYAQRTYAGFPSLVSGFDKPQMLVRGTLVSLTVNVSQAFTGVGTYLMTIAAPAFDGSLMESDLSQVIDCTATGLRTITPAAATGSVGSDTIAAFGNWISAGDLGDASVAVTLSGTGISGGSGTGALSKQPVVTVTFTTTQGQASIGGFQVGSVPSAHGDQLFDTTSYHGSV